MQRELAGKVVAHDDYEHIELVCGVDVSYRNNVAYCSAVVTNRNLQAVQIAGTKSAVKHPYIPGLFMLREAGPILRTLNRVRFDLVMVDGQGQLHPRMCGLACIIGIALNKPAIGVAKSRLCGTVRIDGYVEHGNRVLGFAVNNLYVSVGHRISLDSAIKLVRSFTKEGHRLPEPLRLADFHSRKWF